MDNTHYFIAIPLPPMLKQNYASWQTDLKQRVPYKQWTHPSDFHITLKFLGKVTRDQLEELDHNLQQISSTPSLTLQIGELGTFGKPTSPRVLWVGVKHQLKLFDLQKKVEQVTNEVGFPQEKRDYFPHITLAKKWKNHSISVSMEPIKKRYYGQYQQFLVNQIVIYEINPKQSPKYTCIRTYPLRGE